MQGMIQVSTIYNHPFKSMFVIGLIVMVVDNTQRPELIKTLGKLTRVTIFMSSFLTRQAFEALNRFADAIIPLS